MKAVEVENLRVELARSCHDIVACVSFSIARGEIVGLVGESGSGKTTIGLALLGYARSGTRITEGSIKIDGTDMVSLSARRLRAARGKLVAYIPQDPSAALNPALRVRRQLEELLEVHDSASMAPSREQRIRDVLAEVKLPTDVDFLRRYPHQLSGGQQQRVAIAMAFILRAKAIVLDEPTTGLDVTTQAHVLGTIRELCRNHGVAALYITHDLSVVAGLADRAMVMYSGRIAELGPIHELFERPAHPYTAKLIAAIPDVSTQRTLTPIPGQAPPPGDRPVGCFFAPRCPLRIDRCTTERPPAVEISDGHISRCHRTRDVMRERDCTDLARLKPPRSGVTAPLLSVRPIDAFYGARQVLHGISLELRPHECLALVGESGSGKTTLSRAIIGLAPRVNGEIRFRGEVIAPSARARPVEVQRALQYIFQSPYGSLNPRRSVGEIIATPIEHFFRMRGDDARPRVRAVLERVALLPSVAGRYPAELSGGERQRVAIARALACEPEVLICDEITSALDVSVQAAIIELLRQLREEEGLAMLFVTHNLALARSIADRLLVMFQGRIVEEGDTAAVLDKPLDAYTRELIADTPAMPESLGTGGVATQ